MKTLPTRIYDNAAAYAEEHNLPALKKALESFRRGPAPKKVETPEDRLKRIIETNTKSEEQFRIDHPWLFKPNDPCYGRPSSDPDHLMRS